MPANVRRVLRLSLPMLAALASSSCGWNIPGVYKVPIQQGNVVTVEMLQELKLGMDKRKVSFILGTPLVTDAFHQDRWDYFYSYAATGDRVQQRASLYFEGDRLTRIDADIDSKIDFHTVTKANENVLIVPKKKKGGFLAAITPAFLERDEEQSKEEAIAKNLETGVDQDQPGSGTTGGKGEVLDAALPAAGAAGAETVPGAEPGVATAPSEIYAPNTSAELAETRAPATVQSSASETVSARTESQSKYLQALFAGFGKASTPASSAAAQPAAQPAAAVPAPAAPAEPSILKQTTRD
jgi:outer membrane protein assembly factor BamE